jgi:transcription elongation factor Elf1
MKNEIELPDKKNYIDIKCPVCNSEEYKILFSAGDYEYDLPGIFYVSKCNICGLLYQNPRPELNEILKYYTENYEPYNKVDSGIMAKLRENLQKYWM